MVSQKFILGLLILILAVHILANIYSWYWTYTWLDMPMHFLAGLWLAAVFFHYIKPKLEIANHQFLVSLILALGFVALIGVLYEFFEFFYDIFIASRGYTAISQQGVADTMKDLFFDLIGASVLILTLKIFGKRKTALVN